MNCAELNPLLHAYADGELELVRSLELERHIASCERCAIEHRSIRALRSAFRTADLSFRASPSLRAKVRQIAGPSVPGNSSSMSRPELFWKWLAIGATAFAALVLVVRPAGPPAERVADQAVASHVRSLMAEHLTDVASSDQHTVKPWFAGKLDFAPNVRDLSAEGFPLIGGRLDYIGGRAVAALVYQRNKHFINVFIWPSSAAAGSTRQTESHRGYSVINLDSNGLHYCLVSDLNSKELDELADLLVR